MRGKAEGPIVESVGVGVVDVGADCVADVSAERDKDGDAEALNPLEDPIFYVILIVGAPVFIMTAAAQVKNKNVALTV